MTQIKGSITRAIDFLYIAYQFPPDDNCSEEYRQGYKVLSGLKAYKDALPAHLQNDLEVMSRPMALHCVEAKTMRDTAKLTAEAISDE